MSVDYSSDGGNTFATYYYLRNAQNDVVKLIDGSGNTVVQYTYDTWGKPISTMGIATAGLTSGLMAVGFKTLGNRLSANKQPSACFVAGMMILSSNGHVAIETVEGGDYVYATDPETGESGYKRVVQTFEREADEIVKVTYDFGEEITAPPTHPFYVPYKGWVDAIDLRADDILVTVNGEYVAIEKIQREILKTPITVYNFEVEDFHTYYVSADADSTDTSVLVHNACSFRSRLQKQTGLTGEGMDAHHVFPQKYTNEFSAIDINNNNPLYGSWVEFSAHRSFSYAYNKV